MAPWSLRQSRAVGSPEPSSQCGGPGWEEDARRRPVGGDLELWARLRIGKSVESAQSLQDALLLQPIYAVRSIGRTPEWGGLPLRAGHVCTWVRFASLGEFDAVITEFRPP